jgi:PAS domain S-box-containing protein
MYTTGNRMENYRIEQLLDLGQVRHLLESHHLLSGMAYGLFDPDENNLIAVGWQDICMRFHRMHPLTELRCKESDAYIKAHLHDHTGEFLEYRCKNGMIDVAMPLVVDGMHLATFFTGQFFYDDTPPDRAFFITQAAELGFSSDDYLAALDRVPMFSREYIRNNIQFLHAMVQMMAEMGMKNLRLAHEMEERKAAQAQLEDERLLLQTLIQALPDPVWLKDANGTFLACNGAFGLLFNDTPSSIVGRRDNYYVGDELATFFQEKDREAIAAGQPSTNEEWLTYASDGRHVLWETTKAPVYDAQGQAVGVLGIARDITRHRLLEDELRTKERYQQALLDNFPFMVWLKDIQSRFLAVNRPLLATAGVADDYPYFGKTDLHLFPAELAEQYRADDQAVMESGQKRTTVELIGSLDQLRWHETYKAPVYDDNGNLLGTVGFARDITERKQMEEDILKLNAELSATLQTIPDLLFELDLNGVYLNVWAQNPNLLAARREQLLGRTVQEVLSVEASEVIMAALREADESGSSFGKIIRIDFPEGPKWFEHSVSRKSAMHGNAPHFMLLSRDITERKQMEEALVAREREFRTLAENLPDNLSRYDRECRMLYINPQLLSLLGVSADFVAQEWLGKKTPREVSPDGSLDVYEDALRQTIRSGQTTEFEIILMDKTDGDRYHLVRMIPERNVTGDIVGALAIGLDITERKQMEEALAVREREFRTLAENSPDNIARFDNHCRQIYLNPAMERTLGLDPAWLLGKTPVEQATGDLPRELGGTYERTIRQVLESGEPGEFEMLMPSPAGGLNTHLIRIVAERNAEGTIIGALAIGRDITAIKQAEQRLQLMNFALDHVAEAAYLIDEQGRLTYVNEGACRTLGYSRDELLTMSVADFDPDWPADTWPGHWLDLQKNRSQIFEGRHRAKDGRILPVEINANYFEFGGQGYDLGLVRDISKRKRAQQELQEREQQFRTLAENLPDNICRYDLNGRKSYVNPQLEKTLGRPAASLIGLTPFEEYCEDVGRYRQTLKQVLADGQDAELDLIVPDAEKGERYHNIRFVAERDTDGGVIGVMVIGRDITEYKQAEEANRILTATLEARLLALTQPINDASNLELGDLFNIDELQKIQDAFAQATGVASIITDTQGSPITRPSNFCRLCQHIIRSTEKGLCNCYHSDMVLGRMRTNGAAMQRCLSGSLWDAGASISIGDYHIANWLVGQILDESADEKALVAYAREIGADEEEFRSALQEVTRMSLSQFQKIADALFLIANQLSRQAIQNVQQARFIAEQKRAEEALQAKQHNLAELELELSFAEERERQRIAAVLHDHIGQLLLLGRIKLGALLSSEQPSATLQTVSDVRTLVDEAIQSTRSLTVQLCPPVLGTMGLEPALELLCRQMLEEWELQVEFRDDQHLKKLSSEVRTVLYQTARELLINVGKHAGTRQARLEIGMKDRLFMMTVSDNGAGFDPDTLATVSRQAKGFGLFSVMRRIRNLGGEMTIDSSLLQGTRVVIKIPLAIVTEGT